MKKILLLLVSMALLSVYTLSAQETEPSVEQKETEELVPVIGFIFNTNNILLDLDAYKGGIGIQLLYPDYALRMMANAGYQTGTADQIDLSLGFSFEKPFYIGRVSPYAGISTMIDFTNESQITDDDNWTNTLSLAGTVGGILGAEVFITDFLSFFAEYELSGSIAWTMISQKNNGSLTDPAHSVNYNIDTGLGNSGSIGIVLYLEPTGILPEEEDQ